MRRIKFAKRFRRNYAKMRRLGKNIEKLHTAMDMLADGVLLPPQYKDHALHGEWAGVRDCHIEGDWILLYKLNIDADGEEKITFYATDTHENLFG